MSESGEHADAQQSVALTLGSTFGQEKVLPAARGASTYRKALEHGIATLEAAGLAEARLEAEVLLRHVLQVERAAFLAHPEREISLPQRSQFRALLARRQRHEPVAYIVGHREFFGLDFLVDRRVLVPRPESELLVEQALALLRGRPSPVVADVGTGSGALAISIAVHCPSAQVHAIDSSPDAPAVAAANGARHGVAARVVFLEGNLLQPLPGPVDLIVANLPYIPAAQIARLDPDVRDYEPTGALDGGPEGLDVIARLLAAAPAVLRPGGAALLEIGAAQGSAVKELAQRAFPNAPVAVLPDLAGQDRVVRVLTGA